MSLVTGSSSSCLSRGKHTLICLFTPRLTRKHYRNQFAFSVREFQNSTLCTVYTPLATQTTRCYGGEAPALPKVLKH